MSLLALLAVVLSVSVGRAQQKTLLLVHRTPEAADCPDAAALAQAVHAIVGREVIGTSPEPAATWIEVTMTRLKPGYFANVHTFGTNVGRRELSDAGADCRGLGEAVAVSLALMWSSQEATATSIAPASEAPSEPPSTSPVAPTPVVVPPKKPRPRRVPKPAAPPAGTSSVNFGVDAAVGIAVEVLEHPVPNAELGGRLGIAERFAVSLGVGALGIDRLETQQGFVELGLGYAYLAGCLGITRTSPRLAFCFRPLFGVLRGEGREFERSHSESVLYAALSAGVELRGLLFGRTSYTARVAGVAPLTRNGFSTSDAAGVKPVFTPPVIGLLASIGIGWGGRGHD